MKLKKNINVSIQSKKYNKRVNQILNEWDDQGLNTSTEVCKSILLNDRISKSPTLLNIMNLCNLADKMFLLHDVEENDFLLEDMLNKIITVKSENFREVMDEIIDKADKKEIEQEKSDISKKEPKEIKRPVENIEIIPEKIKFKMELKEEKETIIKEEENKKPELKTKEDIVSYETETSVTKEESEKKESDHVYKIPDSLLFNT